MDPTHEPSIRLAVLLVAAVQSLLLARGLVIFTNL
jgi:hypothetical protein